jgi:hypothetical protein
LVISKQVDRNIEIVQVSLRWRIERNNLHHMPLP